MQRWTWEHATRKHRVVQFSPHAMVMQFSPHAVVVQFSSHAVVVQFSPNAIVVQFSPKTTAGQSMIYPETVLLFWTI